MIIQVIPNLEVGGAEMVVANLATELKNKSQEVIVYCLYGCNTSIVKKLQNDGITIRFFNKKPGFDIKLIHRLRRSLKIDKASIVHSHLYALPYIFLATLLMRPFVKLVHTVHTIPTKEYGAMNLRFNKILYTSGRVIPVAISPEIKHEIEAAFQLPSSRIPMVYNGIETKLYQRKSDYSLHEPIVITHVGSFKEAKNHIFLITEFSRLLTIRPNVVLRLVGDGELRDSIVSLINQLQLQDKIELLGVRSDVPNLLGSSDLFVLPSKWEGMPMALIEAMCTGLPVIVSPVGGIIDMVQNNINGVYTSEQENDFSSKMFMLINDVELRARLGNRAAHDSFHFSTENMVDSYLKVYTKEDKG